MVRISSILFSTTLFIAGPLLCEAGVLEHLCDCVGSACQCCAISSDQELHPGCGDETHGCSHDGCENDPCQAALARSGDKKEMPIAPAALAAIFVYLPSFENVQLGTSRGRLRFSGGPPLENLPRRIRKREKNEILANRAIEALVPFADRVATLFA